MARVPTNRSNVSWAANVAMISLAGVRIFRQGSAAPGAGAEDSYTIQEDDARRLICFHNSGVNTDIRVELNGTAVATDMPMASGVYFAFEVEEGDTVSFFNTSAGSITVNVIEVG